MNYKFYIINYDTDDYFDYVKFHSQIITANGIISWFHYLKSSYIVVTETNVTATNVTDFLMQIMNNKTFFVCELNLQNNNGFLTENAWKWIEKYTN